MQIYFYYANLFLYANFIEKSTQINVFLIPFIYTKIETIHNNWSHYRQACVDFDGLLSLLLI